MMVSIEFKWWLSPFSLFENKKNWPQHNYEVIESGVIKEIK